jgi:central glycolytic genes regulator
MEYIEVFQKIAPDMIGVVEERYQLLHHIAYAQPIGRRMLAQLAGLSERVVRSQVDVLRKNGLVEFTPLGIRLQDDGKMVLPLLSCCFSRMNRLKELEEQLAERLGLKQVIIVPGDSDKNETAKRELGRQSALLLSKYLHDGITVAVSGGSTMAEVADELPVQRADISVVPARGGIGEQVEYQSNVIASVIAGKTGGVYHMLHIPDGMSEEALRLLVETDSRTLEIVELANKAQVVMIGIGRADVMAEKRHILPEQQKQLKERYACGEALGYYCDITGTVVHALSNVGIALTELNKFPTVIAVSGGAEKAEAIIAVMRACKTGILVTDEGAAQQMKNML